MTEPMRLTDQKRESIVQAAIAEFGDRGFEITSMDRIAARAEVSKRTVYNHFPSKEELFAEMLQRLWSCAPPQAEVVFRPQIGLREQLRELLWGKMRNLTNSHFLDLARVVVGATIHSPERAQVWMARINEREETFSAWIRAAQKDGRLKPVDPAFAATQMHALLKSFAFWPQVTFSAAMLTPEEQHNVVESTLDMFLGWYEITR
ncbi:TetR/AcrR family transcriptional regulator [Pseudomonas congelans]|jgi:TetR/AcrR family transcriptional regulator of autoinduction and epiphytic fitness|uniref:Transcriptional regulator, TetR family n=1 Tax=Pseudomonas congelans TaxID=200452 RepID=A0A0P9RNP8_9PSED|nr:TetR/AcrR family transcriptional regulator [Pseudomonas congelans]KPW85970.1 Transcriptional regulator, TetR family [Pseudomonas congelans]MCF5165976.1 TetR family transcriptional regulator [Pseudomonas congelans]PBQ00532.1 TetR/AcrR family transcriptional regulator [Pseudomonas congelans]PBQ04928.1 TetR/AcrR family transcriptional regulator [Pseudomonas congelans]PBQ21964.1 TetR/AcrR family transcriptional regulator [Pseudomonas congelans]